TGQRQGCAPSVEPSVGVAVEFSRPAWKRGQADLGGDARSRGGCRGLTGSRTFTDPRGPGPPGHKGPQGSQTGRAPSDPDAGKTRALAHTATGAVLKARIAAA